MIRFRQSGVFSDLLNYMEKVKETVRLSRLDKYGREGVSALASDTPVDLGLTAVSWTYKIERGNGSVSLSFGDSNIQNGVSTAIILQYEHGTRNGGWVQGKDFINPVIRPIFDKIAEKAWREVTKV